MSDTIGGSPHTTHKELFNDRLASLTYWGPASERSSPSVDAVLQRNADGTLSYAVNVGDVLKTVFYLLFGATLVYAWLFSETQLGHALDSFFETDWYLLTLGIISVAFSGVHLWETCRPEVFDKRKGWYWHGWRTPGHTRRPRLGNRAVRLELIHALQLLSKGVEKDGKTIVLCELNLVLHDADRLNLRCHGDQVQLRKEAQMLSKYLGVPVWDTAAKG
jgi:hypothetical protein